MEQAQEEEEEEEDEPIVIDLRDLFETRLQPGLFERQADGTVLFGIPRCEFHVQGLCEDHILTRDIMVFNNGTISCARCAAWVARDEPEAIDEIVPIRSIQQLKDEYARVFNTRVVDYLTLTRAFDWNRLFRLPQIAQLFSRVELASPVDAFATPSPPGLELK